MNKQEMREWVAALDGALDNKLKKWKKHEKMENGESVQLSWQFEHTRIQVDVFWEDDKEVVNFAYTSPRIDHRYQWSGLNDKTINKIMDRVGNLAQVTLHPPIDPMDHE